jgi:transposase
VAADHLVHVVRGVVLEELDLSEVYAHYEELRGYPPYHPAMMTALLLYGYCRGIYSSRRIEQACEERVDFMALTGMVKPDHSTICQFRTDHRPALSKLFVQVLSLCRDAGMARLGHVALDGTKVKANASKHAAMSYKRMVEEEPELAKVVSEWMEQAKSADEQEDEEHGKEKRGDEIPAHIREKMKKLVKMRAAMERLEKEAGEKAERLKKEREEKAAAEGKKPHEPGPKALDGKPEDKAQSNFTDPESPSRNERRLRAVVQLPGGSGCGLAGHRGAERDGPAERWWRAGPDGYADRGEHGPAPDAGLGGCGLLLGG